MAVAGSETTRTPSMAGTSGTMVASATTTPPGTTASRNFSSEGWFMTTSMFGSTTSGDPTGSSDSVTEQLAVPPRISGP